ncbi:MAG: HlyD family efflux transporter periplasmic adaptor subunit [Silicimonas sp.]|nr:HlyD family efflux transporter periplasmic adaptor subunit [Silicimonas sp.]
MRFLRRSLVGLFLLAATVGLMTYAGTMVWNALQARWSEEPGQRPVRERVFAANVVTISPETIRPVLSTFGEVRSRRTLELRASAAGEVIWLAPEFEEGGAVGAGDLLARIDPADAQSGLDTARADLSEAEADLRDAERSLSLAADDIAAAEDQARLRASALTRQQDLADRGVGSTANVETAELALSSARQAVLSRRQAEASAEARVDQARTALDRRRIALAEAERRLADTEIEAEFAGVLSDVSVVEGGLVSAGENLAQLIDPSALEVAFRVSTPQYTRLLTENGQLVGAEVSVAIDILGVNLEARGTISRESAAVGEGQTGRLLFARLDAAPGFRPGDFVSVRIQEPPLQRVVRLPAAAVDAAGTVLVLGDEDRLEVAPVDVLRRQGDDVIIRARGLAGREVVAERTPLLGAGIRIRPIRRDANGAATPPVPPEMLSLDPDRRARLVAFVEANQFMPAEAKARVLAQLQEDMVPARVVERIESRMGG